MGFLSPSQLDQYHRDGFLIVRRYADIDALRQVMARIVAECDPSGLPIFTTERNRETRETYFLESGDKIRCFFEEEAVDDRGNLLVEKERAVNKVGHALHDLNPVFRR